MAAGAGAVLPLACLNVFLPLTSATAAAASLALMAAGWLRVARLLRSPGRARDGLTLAGLTGLALAADAVAAVLLAPLAVGCWLRAFRKGERWSLLAPVVVFVTGAGGGAVRAVAVHRPDLTEREVVMRWGLLARPGGWRRSIAPAVIEAGEQWAWSGVVAGRAGGAEK